MSQTADDTQLSPDEIKRELMAKKDLLKHQSCFAELTDQEIEILAELLKKQTRASHETLVKEGEPVDGFYIIATGKAGVYKEIDGEQKLIANISANNFDAIGLNELGFYSLSGLRTATVISDTQMILYYLSMPLFHGFSLNYPHVSQVMRKQAKLFAQ